MTLPLTLLLIVLVVPLFASSWRVSLFGLALQGLLLGWIAASDLSPHAAPSAAAAILLVDLFVLRGLVAPKLLHSALTKLNIPPRNDVLPPNLLIWTLAGAAVLVAFRFTGLAAFAEAGLGPAERAHLTISVAALLLGLLVLASRNSPVSQAIGLLRIENAIALFELGSAHHLPAPVQLGLAVVFLLTAVMVASFARRLAAAPKAVDTEARPT